MPAFAQLLQSCGEPILALFYPNVCQICGSNRATAQEGFVCAACWSRRGALKFIVPPFCERCGLPFEGDITMKFECGNCHEMDLHFEFARAAVAAEGLVREVIHRYKYHRALWFEPFLADLLVRRAGPELRATDWDVIVPVPLHPLRAREREFNQSERLARCLGKATGIPVDTRLLHRIEITRTQTQLTRSQRAENVKRAFAIGSEAKLKGRRVIVLDDVLTTGATTSACAEKLRRKGASRVGVWTVARGL